MSCLALSSVTVVALQTHDNAELNELLERNRKLEEEQRSLLERLARIKERFETRINQANQTIADLHRQHQLAERTIFAIRQSQAQDGNCDCLIGAAIGGGIATVLTAGIVILIA